MSNIKTDEQISEEEQNRAQKLIILQQEMKIMLSNNFQNSLDAFRKYKPQIAIQFENYTPINSFDFFCTENGIPNLIFLDHNEFLYKTENPVEFCEKQIVDLISNTFVCKSEFSELNDLYGQIMYKYYNYAANYANRDPNQSDIKENAVAKFKSIPCCIMLGVGLGYPITELFKRIEIANFLLIEPNKDIFFASLYAFDWQSILQYFFNEKISFDILFSNKKEISSFIDEYKRKYQFSFSTGYLPYVQYNNKEIDEIIDVLNEKLDNTMNIGNGYFDDYLFGISHSCYAISHKKNFVLKNKLKKEYQNIPVFVIGSGPSLDNDLPFLKHNQDKAIIIACGTALDVLYHTGIKPDIYACTERGPEIVQTLEIIPDKNFSKDIILFTTDVCHPKTIEYFKYTAIFCKADEPFYFYQIECMPEIKNIMFIQLITPFVGNMGVAGAVYFGFKNIYLFGLDNGKKTGLKNVHSRHTELYNKRGYSDDDPVYETKEEAIGNFGEKCETGIYFKKSAQNIATILALEEYNGRHISCVNCSDGIRIEHTVPKHTYELNAEFDKISAIDKKAFLKYVIQEKTSVINCNHEQLKKLFNKDCFNKTCQYIAKQLLIPLSSRIEYVKKFCKISEYLALESNYIDNFHKSLIASSMNIFFTLAINQLYANLDENKCIETTEYLIKIFCNFLNEAQDLYDLLPYYVLGKHKRYFKNGKLGKKFDDFDVPMIPKDLDIIKNKYKDPVQLFKKNYG